jgi:carbon monoxide dehydrogenase subunit G
MKIAGAHVLPVPVERAWALLQDPQVLSSAIPGCDSLEATGENEYAMRMKLALASLSGAFEGKVRLTEPQPPNSFRLIVEGKGKIGFMKGEGLLTLAPKEASTQVSYDGDVHVGGTIAAVGQRLIDTTARMMIKRFFDNIAAKA